MRRAIAALSAAALLAGCGGEDAEKPAAPRTQASEQQPAADPARLAAEWWQWAGKRREGRDPVTDRTGRRCAQDQPDDVFFLAGTFGGAARRTCTVPAGRAIFVPVLNQVCPVEGDPDRAADACRASFEGATAKLVVDDRDVEAELVVSPPFEHDPHPQSAAGTAGESVAAGLHVLLDPLPEGEHEIRFAGKRDDFSLSVRYDLTVEGG